MLSGPGSERGNFHSGLGSERWELAFRQGHAPLASKATELFRCWGSLHFRFASALATSCACSMKSLAMGLSVRFFRVTIPAGMRAMGSATGRTFSSGLVRNGDGAIVRKRPVARRLIRNSGELVTSVARGEATPLVRHTYTP